VVIPPRQVDVLGIGAAAEYLSIADVELAVQLAEGRDLGGADEGEILGPKEVDLPLAGIAFIGDGFKRLFLSVLMVAVTENEGNFSPTDSMNDSLWLCMQ
jgi:hypothetical protein